MTADSATSSRTEVIDMLRWLTRIPSVSDPKAERVGDGGEPLHHYPLHHALFRPLPVATARACWLELALMAVLSALSKSVLLSLQRDCARLNQTLPRQTLTLHTNLHSCCSANKHIHPRSPHSTQCDTSARMVSGCDDSEQIFWPKESIPFKCCRDKALF